jgi:hypothetical protein
MSLRPWCWILVTSLLGPAGCSNRTDNLEEGIVGNWTAQQGRDVAMNVEFTADHVVNAKIRDKADGPFVPMRGVWSLKDKVLTVQFMTWSLSAPFPDNMKTPSREEIISLSADTIVLKDLEGAKNTSTMARISGNAAQPAAVKAELPPSQAAIPAPSSEQSQSVSTQQSTPPAEAINPPRLLSDETYYVATKEESLVTFKLPKPAEVALVIDIDNQVPLDIVLWPGPLTETQYANMKVNIGMGQMGDVLRTISGDNSKPGKKFTEADLFFHPQSKRGAYGHRETAWFPYDAGTSTIVLDNSGDLTTTRGDAPVRVQIWTRPLQK